MPSLQELELGGIRASDADLLLLARLNLKHLEWLSLQGNQVTDAGLIELAGMTWLSLVFKTKVTGPGVAGAFHFPMQNRLKMRSSRSSV